MNLYSTDFRNYDPQLGRFTGIDALSEITGDVTPYQYAINDPIYWNDPTGLMETSDSKGWHWGGYGWLPNTDDEGQGEAQNNSISASDWNYIVDTYGGIGDNGSGGSGGGGEGGNYGSRGVGPHSGGGNGGGPGDPPKKKKESSFVSGLKYFSGFVWNHALNTFTAAEMTLEWEFGIGDDQRIFINDRVANAFRNARVVNQAREYWYNQVNEGKKTIHDGVTNFLGRKAWTGGNFGFKGFVSAGIDPLEQFVGSFTPTITSDGHTLTFTIKNTTSFKSLMYGIAPNWYRSTWAPGGDMTQTYIFTELIDFTKIH